MSSVLARGQDIFYALIGSCCKTGKSPFTFKDVNPIRSSSSFIIISNLDATLKLNGRSFKILKLLGEGGFSYVSEFDYSIIRSVPLLQQFKNSLTQSLVGRFIWLKI